jgi:hypothetical protein
MKISVKSPSRCRSCKKAKKERGMEAGREGVKKESYIWN